ncbi:lanthionine synthetase LanC family protein [Hallella sp.]|uniref:lanthionine synthetase LanC family protein n=1 Tax=Hallella sp. TaxID=2980186 RepID=UPI0038B29023
MTNKEIDHIIACEIERMSKASNPFLRNGYMGMCVFLFKMYEFTSDKKYYQLAQEILTRACDLLKKRSKVNMIDGLSGIACPRGK